MVTTTTTLTVLLLASVANISTGDYQLKCSDQDGAASSCTVAFSNWRENEQIPIDHLVCSVAIKATIRSFPFTCPSYNIQSITISKPQSPLKQPLDFTPPPNNVQSCEPFSDLSLRKENSNDTDLMDDMFCPYGIQPSACENSTPELEIKTTEWNASSCSKESCSDDYPLLVQVGLSITTEPVSSIAFRLIEQLLSSIHYVLRFDQSSILV